MPAIALASNGLDQDRGRRLRLDLSPEPHDVDVDGAGLDIPVHVVPDVNEEVIAGDDLAAVLNEVAEDVSFSRSQCDDLAVTVNL